MPAKTPMLERPRSVREPGGPLGGGPDGGGGDAAVPATTPARIAVWLLVSAITILFAAFTSTFLARRGEADWRVGPLPGVLWISTAVILASSLFIEWGRRRGRRGETEQLHAGLLVTTGLGLGFLAAQIAAWRQLVALGVYLATNPHGAFFYLLTGAHALHLAGGIGGLLYALRRIAALSTPAEALDVVDPVATYWHFLTGLWVYLFIILFAI